MKIEDKFIGNIHYKFFLPAEKPNKVLVTIHGFAGDSDSSTIYALAQHLTQSNTLVVAFDLPCHGKDKSSGDLVLQDCFDYLLNVVNYVKTTYTDCSLSFFATSFGGYILLNNLNKIGDIDHIILKSPAIFMDEVLKNLLQKNGFSVQDLEKNHIDLGFERPLFVNYKFLTDLSANSLKHKKFAQYIDIIQGDRDDVVDIYSNEEFYKQNCLDYSLHYIKGADHRFKNVGELDKIIKIVDEIL